MEIAVFIVAPNGTITDELVADPETEVFFDWQDADDAAKECGGEAKAFSAVTTFYAAEFSPVD